MQSLENTDYAFTCITLCHVRSKLHRINASECSVNMKLFHNGCGHCW